LKKKLGKASQLLAFVLIAYASYLLILLSLPYFAFRNDVDFLKTKQLIHHIDIWMWSFYIHVFSSPFIIVSGLFQFNRKLIKRRPKLHRSLGKIYIIVLLFISGPAAFVMSLHATGGRIAQFSFVVLTLFWILSTFLAYYHIRKKNIEKHIKWMIRSYALTLAAVTLRFYAYLFDVFNLPLGSRETYILLAYISWLPNALLAEVFIRFGYAKYLMKYPEA
jgi:uncharacterized membrane protein